MFSRICITLIRLYQKTISFDHGPIRRYLPEDTPPMCRYDPTCSDYGLTAIERFGSWKGGILTIKRILRCHPWTKHPVHDPVPEKRQ